MSRTSVGCLPNMAAPAQAQRVGDSDTIGTDPHARAATVFSGKGGLTEALETLGTMNHEENRSKQSAPRWASQSQSLHSCRDRGVVGILLYIAFAFRNTGNAMLYGTCAIVGIHDALFVLGVFSILGAVADVEIDALFVTAVLTVIGFSVMTPSSCSTHSRKPDGGPSANRKTSSITRSSDAGALTQHLGDRGVHARRVAAVRRRIDGISCSPADRRDRRNPHRSSTPVSCWFPGTGEIQRLGAHYPSAEPTSASEA